MFSSVFMEKMVSFVKNHFPVFSAVFGKVIGALGERLERRENRPRFDRSTLRRMICLPALGDICRGVGRLGAR